jgi:hypothetical protein
MGTEERKDIAEVYIASFGRNNTRTVVPKKLLDAFHEDKTIAYDKWYGWKNVKDLPPVDDYPHLNHLRERIAYDYNHPALKGKERKTRTPDDKMCIAGDESILWDPEEKKRFNLASLKAAVTLFPRGTLSLRYSDWHEDSKTIKDYVPDYKDFVIIHPWGLHPDHPGEHSDFNYRGFQHRVTHQRHVLLVYVISDDIIVGFQRDPNRDMEEVHIIVPSKW